MSQVTFSVFHYRLSDWQWVRNEQDKVEFVVKFKTEELVDLELNTPSHMMKLDDVTFKSDGFIPRGSNYYSTVMRMMAVPARE